MSTLLVQLPVFAPGAHAPDISASTELRYALSLDGETSVSSGTAVAALLPRADQVVAVVPAQALSWHRVDVPKMPAARWQQGLQAMLEEQLLTPVEQLHLCAMPGYKAGSAASGVWVAACDSAWLRAALQVVEAAGRAVSRIAPGLAPVGADDAAHTQVQAAGGQAWVSTSSAEGVWCYPLDLHSSIGVPCAPTLQVEPALAARAASTLASGAYNAPISVTPAPDLLLAALRTPWNLGQGEFARNTNTKRWGSVWQGLGELAQAKPWRLARWALAGTLLVQLLGLNAWAWMERQSLADKRERMQLLLTQTFPQVKLVVDAPVQMQREMQALQQRMGQGSQTDLESMLHLLGQANASGTSASGIDFENGKAVFRNMSLPPADLDRLQQLAQTRGLNVQVQGSDLVMGVKP
jgi:general secretion pathway protein L